MVRDKYFGTEASEDASVFHGDVAGILFHMLPEQKDSATSYGRRSGKTLRSDAMVATLVAHGEGRELIHLRNKFAAFSAPSWMRGGDQGDKHSADEKEGARQFRVRMPQVTGNGNGECNRCFKRHTCMWYHRAFDEEEDCGLGQEAYVELVGHLETAHAEYFKEWNEMIDAEEAHLEGHLKELWTHSGRQRQRKGRCYSEAILTKVIDLGDRKSLCTFSPREMASVFPIEKVQIGEGDAVIVGVEGAQHMLATGFVESLAPDEITIATRKLLPRRWRPPSSAGTSWRIDKQELISGLKMVRANLTSLFVQPSRSGTYDRKTAIRRLELIVDLKPPEFDKERREALRVLGNCWFSGERSLSTLCLLILRMRSRRQQASRLRPSKFLQCSERRSKSAQSLPCLLPKTTSAYRECRERARQLRSLSLLRFSRR